MLSTPNTTSTLDLFGGAFDRLFDGVLVLGLFGLAILVALLVAVQRNDRKRSQ